MQSLILFLLLALSPSLILAQYPPTPSGLTVVHSSVDAAVTISFKETEVCNQSPAAKSYSGFVHLPGNVLTDVGGYNISTYFLYFEARHNPSTAPLAIYFAGGPGESSTYTALAGESGPCIVNYDGTNTTSNPWSLNNNVNVLYIDQPVQVGFSYDELVHATYNLNNDGAVIPLGPNQSPPSTVNASFGYGTYPSQKFDRTAKNTVQAGKMLWYFFEHWLSSFPEYKTSSNQVSIWGNSYGGYWVPEAAVVLAKNLKNLTARHPLKPKCLAVDTVGITNGCIDSATGSVGWPQFAYNNTYGVHFATEAQYKSAMHNLTKPNGCLDLTKQCRELGEAGDPDFSGNNATVNTMCMEAFGYCALYVVGGSPNGGFPKMNKRDPFDVATVGQPCPFWLPVQTYLATASVQQDLGVPLNFTYDSNTVATDFGVFAPDPNYPVSKQSGDAARQNGLPHIEYFLDNNIKVAFIFGDRDYRCPWTGGEAVALAAKWAHQDDFADAGYEEIQGVTKQGTDHGGLVKQYGNFSFSRVFDSGHAVSAYAPSTVYEIFQRTMLGMDVVTGQEKVGAGYSTTGPTTSWQWRNELRKTPPETCIVLGEFSEKNPFKAIGGNY